MLGRLSALLCVMSFAPTACAQDHTEPPKKQLKAEDRQALLNAITQDFVKARNEAGAALRSAKTPRK